MNLISLAERLAGAKEAPARLDVQRCLHARDKFCECDACFPVCPAGAIEPGKPPRLDAGACQHCRACLPVCPTGAYSMEDAVPDLLRCAARVRAEVLEITCELHPEAEDGPPSSEAAIRVRGCLAGLGTGAYLQLAARPVRQIIVRTDVCEQCPWGQLKSQIEGQIDTAQRLLQPWHKDNFIRVSGPRSDDWVSRPLHHADSPPISRRDLFRGRIEEEQSLEDVAGGEHPFRERLRTLSALQQLPAYDETEGVLPLSGAGFARLTVSDDCTACNTCARACPGEALTLEKDEDAGRFALTFSAQACLACDICAHLCPDQAISVDHTPTFHDVFGRQTAEVLIEGPLRRCARCNAHFAPAEPAATLCPVCAFRKENPFGSRMPPNLAARMPTAGRVQHTNAEEAGR